MMDEARQQKVIENMISHAGSYLAAGLEYIGAVTCNGTIITQEGNTYSLTFHKISNSNEKTTDQGQ